jgi:hypothetical protein
MAAALLVWWFWFRLCVLQVVFGLCLDPLVLDFVPKLVSLGLPAYAVVV